MIMTDSVQCGRIIPLLLCGLLILFVLVLRILGTETWLDGAYTKFFQDDSGAVEIQNVAIDTSFHSSAIILGQGKPNQSDPSWTKAFDLNSNSDTAKSKSNSPGSQNKTIDSPKTNLLEEESKPTASAREEILPHLGSGFRGEHIFHVTSGAKLVEGVVFLKIVGSLTFPFQSGPDWAKDRDTAGKTATFQRGRCVWCPRTSIDMEVSLRQAVNTSSGETSNRLPDLPECRYGRFRSGWFKDDTSATLRGDPTKASMLNLRGSTEKWNRRFWSTALSCVLQEQIPLGIEGVLRVENLPKFVFYVNPAKNQTLRKESSVVCVKAPHGNVVSSHAMTQFALHYLVNLNFTTVAFFEQGQSRGFLVSDLLKRDRRLRPFVKNGRVLVVEQRDSLQRLYGVLGPDVNSFSVSNGQLLAIADCITRAKVDGFEWALIVDHDEILAPGQGRIGQGLGVETWVDFVARNEKEWSSKAQIQVFRFNRMRPNETAMCDECEMLDGDALVKHIRREVERRWSSPSPPGKSAVRLDPTSPHPLTNTVGIHSVANSGAFPAISSESVTLVVNDSDVVIRHYYCLNAFSKACESVPVAMYPNHDWALPDLQP